MMIVAGTLTNKMAPALRKVIEWCGNYLYVNARYHVQCTLVVDFDVIMLLYISTIQHSTSATCTCTRGSFEIP